MEGDEKIYCPTQDTLENEMRYPERYRDCPRHTGRCEHLIHAVRGAEALGQNQPVMPLTAGISMWAGPHPSLSSPISCCGSEADPWPGTLWLCSNNH